MNIRKLFMSALVLTMTLATATCFAQISKSDLNIGGIYYGQPWSDFIAKYGQPIRKEPRAGKGYNYVFRYGSIEFTANQYGDYVGEVFVKDNDTLATKAGIRVGSSLSEIQTAYGQPDRTSNGSLISLEYGTGWESYDCGNGYSMDIQPKLVFFLNATSKKVINIRFTVDEDWENMYPTGSKSPEQQKPSQSYEPTKPKSTIPDSVTQVSASELSLGWIEPGQPMSKVEEVYGKPGKIDDQGFFRIYNYNDKFVVKGKMNNGYKVTSVASYEKGIKTPSGYTVGDSYSAIAKKIGVVNGIKYKGDELEAKMKNLKGCTDYTYFSGKKQIVFLVDKKGIIQAIRVEDYDEQKFIEARRKK